MHTHEVLPSQKDPALLEKIVRKVKMIFSGTCQRILLINIPQVAEEDFDLATAQLGKYPCFPPYGPGLLSRDLQTAGYQTELLDLNFGILDRVKDPSFHYRIWQSLVDEAVASFGPDLVGVSCMFSMTHPSMKAVVEYVKEHYPHLPIVAGGVHVSGNTQLVLKEIPSIDFALRYEGDIALVEIVNFVNGRVSAEILTQVATIADGEYLEIEQRSVPKGDVVNHSPEYHSLPIGRYSKVGNIGAYRWLRTDNPAVGTILAYRGCRAACTFCSVHSFNGVGVRGRASTIVVDEIQRMVENYGIRHFMWLDDDLFRPDAAIDLFPEITRRKLDITWDASNGVIARASTPEMIKAASESGCIGLSFGIESGNEKILRAVKKPSMVEHFMAVSETLEDYPEICAKGFLMFGFPDESIGQIRDTVNLALKMGLDWYPIQMLSPFGGTAMAKDMIKKGVVDEHAVLSNNFFVGPSGKQQAKERNEIASSTFNHELLEASQDQDRVPSQDELADIWFLMNYKVNYEPVAKQTDPIKLRIKRLLLRDMRERVPKHIPTAGFFLGIVNQKLGNHDEARKNFEDTKLDIEGSAYWQVRFDKLGLTDLLNSKIRAS